MPQVRIAAAGDLHAEARVASRIEEAFSQVGGAADVVLLAGDLTAHGEPDEIEVVAAACARLTVPIYAVLGNHDYHAGRADEVAAILSRAGIHVLHREAVVCEVGGVDLGIVGTKGFVGGFPGAEIPDFGEPLLRSVYHETTLEVEALEAGLEEIAGCHRRIVLLHYAPVADTLVGEPEPIWAFLGSSRLATPIGAHRPDLVLHGHAHRGSFVGAVGDVPVRNVAVHVTGEEFAFFDL
jgi:Icc-related predicted phosphoesterase